MCYDVVFNGRFTVKRNMTADRVRCKLVLCVVHGAMLCAAEYAVMMFPFRMLR